jgi:O-acetylhomoserine (thiol)-lyase
LPRYGIEVTFVDDPDDLDSWKKAIIPNTKALFGEIISKQSNEFEKYITRIKR